jgi:hypothetical protein
MLGWEFKSGANPGYGGGNHQANSADTWYPTWGANGNLYTPWTDGGVVDDNASTVMVDGYTSSVGALAAGHDIKQANMTFTEAMGFCNDTAACVGFTFKSEVAEPAAKVATYFKSAWAANTDTEWHSYFRGVAPATAVRSGSGGKPALGYSSTTGQAVISGDDPFALKVTRVKTFASSTYPYQGRYPCGSLYYKGKNGTISYIYTHT